MSFESLKQQLLAYFLNKEQPELFKYFNQLFRIYPFVSCPLLVHKLRVPSAVESDLPPIGSLNHTNEFHDLFVGGTDLKLLCAIDRVFTRQKALGTV